MFYCFCRKPMIAALAVLSSTVALAQGDVTTDAPRAGVMARDTVDRPRPAETAGDRDSVFPASPHALYQRDRYSPAVRANGFLFVSGQVGSRPDGTREPDLEAEARRAFDNLSAVLAAAGCTFKDVIDVTIFIVDPDTNLAAFEKVRPLYWGRSPYPTLTGVGVTWLAGFNYEIKVVAKLPSKPVEKVD